MIALGIFFAAVFTILALVSQILRNARGLQRPQVDAGMAAALYVNTNRFPEGTVSGDLGDSLAGYSYEIATDEFATNGLMQADVVLYRRRDTQAPDTLSILVFDPNHASTPFGGRR
jgi:predicted permease